MSRRIEDLTPSLQIKARQLTNLLYVNGIKYAIIETRRSMATQRAYYAQGREPFEEVNAKRRAAGLFEIGEAEARRIVTRTLDSRHLYGEAFDLVPLDEVGRAWWNAPAALWTKIGELGESVGLEWGGRWGEREGRLGWDCPHFQERA